MTNLNDLKKEFEKKFDYVIDAAREEQWNWIETVLVPRVEKKVRDEVIKIAEGMEKVLKIPEALESYIEIGSVAGYNQALSDLIDNIKKLKERK